MLQPLEADVAIPPFIDRKQLVEVCVWMGSGGQVTPLHFDESENLNFTVFGRKRWILYPWATLSELPLEFRRTVASRSFDELAETGDIPAGGYEVVTEPGDCLYLPSGCAHHVWAIPGPSLNVVHWFLPDRLPMLVRVATARRARLAGVDRMSWRGRHGWRGALGVDGARAVGPSPAPHADFNNRSYSLLR